MNNFNPCKECGSPVIKEFHHSYRRRNKIKFNYTVMCDNCGRSTSDHRTNRAAIGRWNELNPTEKELY